MKPFKVSKVPTLKTAWLCFTGSIRALTLQALGRFDTKTSEEYISWWWKSILETGDATLSSEETTPLDPDQAYVFMSNHISALDIPAIFGGVHPRRIRMVSKQQVSKIPLFGKALTRMDFVFIDRGTTRAIAQLEKAKSILAKGVSVWMAPEGTRSRTGKVGPFKRGGFHMAIQLGCPIVPTWLEGTADICPPDQFDCAYDGHIAVRFGKPVSTQGCDRKDIPRLMAEVRASMLELSKRPLEEVDGGNIAQDKRLQEPLQPGYLRQRMHG